jgi:transcriptional regulator with XRE-family HTH domain
MSEIGKEVRRLRKERDWTQEQLAVYAGSSQPTINQIESGARNPSTRTLEKIARAFGMEVRDLFPLGQAPLFPAPPSGEAFGQRRSAEDENLARWLGLMVATAERIKDWLEENEGPALNGADVRARAERTQEFVDEIDGIRLWAPDHAALQEAEEWLARLKAEASETIEQEVETHNAREGREGADAAEEYSLARDRKRRKAGA